MIYRFADEDGGWAAGVIESALEDEDDTVQVTEGEMVGYLPLNFFTKYADDEVKHCLQLDDYATSMEAEEGAWCLLAGAPKGKGKGKAPAEASRGKGKAPAKVQDVSKMRKEERRQMRAALAAMSSDEDG
jgi:hypothetical protein